MRKGPAVGGAKRTNILGAKKGQKLGAKKVAGEEIDFEAAEKAAKAEAERIEKLGYDPEAEAAQESTKVKSPTTATRDTSILAPTPISPPQTGYGNKQQHQRSPSEIERLGMGMGRLGFGQVGRTQSASSAPAPKKLGFGSVGTTKAAAQGMFTPLPCKLSTLLTPPDESDDYARTKFGTQKGISSDEFFGRNNFDPQAQQEAKQRLQGFDGATSISSNAYFGRPEDDLTGLAGGDYGDIETVAKDFIRKMGLTAGDDLENLINVAGEGGRRLRGAVARYLNS